MRVCASGERERGERTGGRTEEEEEEKEEEKEEEEEEKEEKEERKRKEEEEEGTVGRAPEPHGHAVGVHVVVLTVHTFSVQRQRASRGELERASKVREG